jgi:hypothetical protein
VYADARLIPDPEVLVAAFNQEIVELLREDAPMGSPAG